MSKTLERVFVSTAWLLYPSLKRWDRRKLANIATELDEPNTIGLGHRRSRFFLNFVRAGSPASAGSPALGRSSNIRLQGLLVGVKAPSLSQPVSFE